MKVVKLAVVILLINADFAFSDETQKEVCTYNESLEKYQLDREKLINHLFLKSGISLNCLPDDVSGYNSLLNSKMYALDGKPNIKKCVVDKNDPKNLSTSYGLSRSAAEAELVSILTTLGLDETSMILFRSSIYDPHKNIFPTDCTIQKEKKTTKQSGPSFFIRQSPDEISKQQKESKGALFSLSEDSKENNKSRTINGVMGFQWNKGDLLFGAETVRTFVGINRTSKIVNSESNQKDQVMETSLGATFENSSFGINALGMQAGWWVSAYSIIATSEQYEDSTVTDLEYTATLGLSAAKNKFFWLDDWKGIGSFLIKPNLQLKLVSGHVNDQGTAENLRDSEEYIRFGPSVGFTIAGNRPWNERLVLDGRYTYLDIHNSPLDRAENKKITFSYFLDKDEKFAITYSYEEGRTGVNLNDVDKWNLGISYKY
jgi:hypothetical protein